MGSRLHRSPAGAVRTAVALSALLLLLGAPFASTPAHGADAWREYWAAVARYPSEGRAAVETALGTRGPGDDERLLLRLASLRKKAARCADCPARAELAELPLEAAALYHTERAWSAPGPADRGQLDTAFGLALARGALPEGIAFAKRWLLATVLKAHAAADGSLALRYAEEGARLHPDDGELRLAAGTLHESLAGVASLPLPGAIDDLARARLAEAERHFASVAGGPAFEEARLRLGRVRVLLGQGGLRELEESAARAGAPRIACLGWLFLGRVRENASRWAEAEAAYRSAAAACPEAQTPRLARAAVLLRFERAAEARQETEAALALADDRRRRDPFAAYPWGRSGDADLVLSSLGAAR